MRDLVGLAGGRRAWMALKSGAGRARNGFFSDSSGSTVFFFAGNAAFSRGRSAWMALKFGAGRARNGFLKDSTVCLFPGKSLMSSLRTITADEFHAGCLMAAGKTGDGF